MIRCVHESEFAVPVHSYTHSVFIEFRFIEQTTELGMDNRSV